MNERCAKCGRARRKGHRCKKRDIERKKTETVVVNQSPPIPAPEQTPPPTTEATQTEQNAQAPEHIAEVPKDLPPIDSAQKEDMQQLIDEQINRVAIMAQSGEIFVVAAKLENEYLTRIATRKGKQAYLVAMSREQGAELAKAIQAVMAKRGMQITDEQLIILGLLSAFALPAVATMIECGSLDKVFAKFERKEKEGDTDGNNPPPASK